MSWKEDWDQEFEDLICLDLLHYTPFHLLDITDQIFNVQAPTLEEMFIEKQHELNFSSRMGTALTHLTRFKSGSWMLAVGKIYPVTQTLHKPLPSAANDTRGTS